MKITRKGLIQKRIDEEKELKDEKETRQLKYFDWVFPDRYDPVEPPEFHQYGNWTAGINLNGSFQRIWCLNIFTQGYQTNQRIGNRIRIKKIEWNLAVTDGGISNIVDGSKTTQKVPIRNRVLLFWDKQPSNHDFDANLPPSLYEIMGALDVNGELYVNNNISQFQNVYELQRFDFLWDWWFYSPPKISENESGEPTVPAETLYFNEMQNISEIDCEDLNLKTTYNTFPETIPPVDPYLYKNISKGRLYFLVMTDGSIGPSQQQWILSGSIRITFEDL